MWVGGELLDVGGELLDVVGGKLLDLGRELLDVGELLNVDGWRIAGCGWVENCWIWVG